MSPQQRIAIVDAWQAAEAQAFFRNVWPMYVHEISGFDTDFYALSETGRWLPDIVEDWISSPTPPQNLREARSEDDALQPFQRAHVITCDSRQIGFICIGLQPFKYMPEDADVSIAELFLARAARGNGTAVRALELVLQRYPGRYSLLAIGDNLRAIRFWRKALTVIGVRDLEERSEDRDLVFRFSAHL
jgi:predicted acetyltransferase